MKTCGTCRFMGAEMGVTAWDEAIDDTAETSHHACARIIHGNDGRRFPTIRDEPAIVTDGSVYAARLRVLPTFGCVLHEDAALSSSADRSKP